MSLCPLLSRRAVAYGTRSARGLLYWSHAAIVKYELQYVCGVCCLCCAFGRLRAPVVITATVHANADELHR